MPVNPASGSRLRAVTKLLPGSSKDESSEEPENDAPPAEKAPPTTAAKKAVAKKASAAKKTAATTTTSPAKTETTVTKTSTSTAKKTAAAKAPAKKAPAKKAGGPEESQIPAAVDLADALETPPVAGTVQVDAQGKKILPDIPDAEFEKDLATDPTLKEDEKSSYTLSAADESDEPVQQVMVAGATAVPV
ncbi:MAG: polymerase sigma factor [Aeromicrobium sp.]|nr:polymerase sigma factor [Aeromicrobium sp.]